MSAIDCKIHIDKKQAPSGDRVVLTFEYACHISFPQQHN